jgi:hypothetical protein
MSGLQRGISNVNENGTGLLRLVGKKTKDDYTPFFARAVGFI